MSETGYRYKWVRTEFQGAPDTANVAKHLSRGWTPVPLADIPEFMLSEAAPASGLTAYRIPEEQHDRLTGAMFAENARREDWATQLPAGIQNYSNDAKEAIMAKLEDHYHPTMCAHLPKALNEANALRRQLGQPERTLQEERRDALAYYAKKWDETTDYGYAQMREYRRQFRMPHGLVEWAAMIWADMKVRFQTQSA